MEHGFSASSDPPAGGSLSLAGAALVVVLPWLERSRASGFLGPGPVAPHIEHALGFADVVGSDSPAACVDLGSGGGLPGLVLAAVWPEAEVVLLDSNERRTAFLAGAVTALGWALRIRVVRARAEVAGRDDGLRGQFPLVVSRSFGPPPATAECAAPLLAVGGRLVVSEPPPDDSDRQRWPAPGLAVLGMAAGRRVSSARGTYQVLDQRSLCPESFPRRVGVPVKRPLW